MVLTDPTAGDSLAAMRECSRFGVKMDATTVATNTIRLKVPNHDRYDFFVRDVCTEPSPYPLRSVRQRRIRRSQATTPALQLAVGSGGTCAKPAIHQAVSNRAASSDEHPRA